MPDYLAGKNLTFPTKSALKKAIKKDLITVNGGLGSTALYIEGGEEVKIFQEKERKINRTFILPLQVIYEDEFLAVVHKPPGILVSGNSFQTINNALEQNLKPSSESDAVQPRAVHRLDYPTAGLLLIGKTSSTIIELNRLFAEKRVEKKYMAVTIGIMNDQKGMIDSPVDKKTAESSYRIIQAVKSERFGALNLVELSPKTGRRHQLRKHLAEIGNPILGDQTYGKETLILKGKGLYLFAQSLDFIHPITKERIWIESELPSKYWKIFKKDE